MWLKTYGSFPFDWFRSIQRTSDGGYIVAGFNRSLGAGDNDIWVLKLDTSGDVVWQKTYGGSDSDVAWEIQQTLDNGYILLVQLLFLLELVMRMLCW